MSASGSLRTGQQLQNKRGDSDEEAGGLRAKGRGTRKSSKSAGLNCWKKGAESVGKHMRGKSGINDEGK